MNTFKITILTTAMLLAVVGPSTAQDAMPGHDMSTMGQSGASTAQSMLPEICKTAGAMGSMNSMGSMGSMEMDAAHTDLMAGMDAMNQDMMIGAMAEDIDVAFVCGMIPHHQGAISMAKAELEHGDDEWAKEMAQKVIDAQEAEIADMLAWLEEQAAK
ncbi:DUF305 domain-containing protein [Devosia sp.]|jgi:uncharacterized protein (DUF305 family)|uniref:CopM family metallochaperone n=1 Tax=Devosia sp. TaxID=1871048 RepID=UPI0025BA5E22|nr:DUF305 domain-containing protein [Devosia sp.]